jgi:hypothetical protein
MKSRIEPKMLCWIIALRHDYFGFEVRNDKTLCETKEYVGNTFFGGKMRDAWDVLLMSGDIGETARVESCCLFPIPPDEIERIKEKLCEIKEEVET